MERVSSVCYSLWRQKKLLMPLCLRGPENGLPHHLDPVRNLYYPSEIILQLVPVELRFMFLAGFICCALPACLRKVSMFL